jgi:hypothetical protein
MIRINLLSARKPAGAKAVKRAAPKIEMGANLENLVYVVILAAAILWTGLTWWRLSSERDRLNRDVAAANEQLETVKEGLRIVADPSRSI